MGYTMAVPSTSDWKFYCSYTDSSFFRFSAHNGCVCVVCLQNHEKRKSDAVYLLSCQLKQDACQLAKVGMYVLLCLFDRKGNMPATITCKLKIYPNPILTGVGIWCRVDMIMSWVLSQQEGPPLCEKCKHTFKRNVEITTRRIAGEIITNKKLWRTKKINF